MIIILTLFLKLRIPIRFFEEGSESFDPKMFQILNTLLLFIKVNERYNEKVRNEQGSSVKVQV